MTSPAAVSALTDEIESKVVTFRDADGQFVPADLARDLGRRLAEAKERERCAKIVDEYARRDQPNAVTVCDLAAAAIRQGQGGEHG